MELILIIIAYIYFVCGFLFSLGFVIINDIFQGEGFKLKQLLVVSCGTLFGPLILTYMVITEVYCNYLESKKLKE